MDSWLGWGVGSIPNFTVRASLASFSPLNVGAPLEEHLFQRTGRAPGDMRGFHLSTTTFLCLLLYLSSY